MKRSRFPEEQIMAILKKQEAYVKLTDNYRAYGISTGTFHKWKSMFIREDKLLEEPQHAERPGFFMTI